jgi:transcriptional regulator with XRE-family HTH domain
MKELVQHPKSIGRNIAKLRGMKGMKQSTLATKIGTTHQEVSRLEKKDVIPDEKLEQIAKALGVTVDAIKEFHDEASAISINNMHDNSQAIYQYNFNPVDKIVELYDRLLKTEKEKNELLESLLNKRK